MIALRILSVITIISLVILGVEFPMTLKKNKKKTVDEILPSLIIRLNIIMALIILYAVIKMILIFLVS